MHYSELWGSFQGIYKITNTQNGKVYVGQSLDIRERWMTHIRLAFREKNPSQQLIHRAMRKYGEEYWQFEILEEVTHRDLLDEREIYWVGILNSLFPKGYNLVEGGKSRKGFVLGVEGRKKLSEALKGRKFSKEHRDKISSSLKGREFSEEHRKNISLTHKGIPLGTQDPEHRDKIQAARKEFYSRGCPEPLKEIFKKNLPKGTRPKSISLEHKAKISAARKGNPTTLDTTCMTSPDGVRERIPRQEVGVKLAGGWLKGWEQKVTRGYVNVTSPEGGQKRVPKEELESLLELGWKRGWDKSYGGRGRLK